MNVDAKEKMCQDRGDGRGSIEKWIVRKAFDTKEDPYLPDEILWRQKEQFSDGVGYSWIDGLRDLAEESVSDLKMKNAKHLFPHNTPPTKENYMYRSIFERHYPSESSAKTVPGGKSIACSTERVMSWDSTFEAMADASGRSILGVHVDGKDQVNVDSKPAAKKAKR
jgi:asparagine synthase (glutamine-hydrolysing)